MRGILAAWAADESLLGDGASAHTQLLQIAAAGDLDHGVGSPKGVAYVASALEVPRARTATCASATDGYFERLCRAEMNRWRVSVSSIILPSGKWRTPSGEM